MNRCDHLNNWTLRRVVAGEQHWSGVGGVFDRTPVFAVAGVAKTYRFDCLDCGTTYRVSRDQKKIPAWLRHLLGKVATPNSGVAP